MYLIKTLEKDKVIEENFLYNNLNLASTDFDECDNLFIANFNFKFRTFNCICNWKRFML